MQSAHGGLTLHFKWVAAYRCASRYVALGGRRLISVGASSPQLLGGPGVGGHTKGTRRRNGWGGTFDFHERRVLTTRTVVVGYLVPGVLPVGTPMAVGVRQLAGDGPRTAFALGVGTSVQHGVRKWFG